MIRRLALAALVLGLFAGAAPIKPAPESGLMAADRAFSKMAAQHGRFYAFFSFMADDASSYGIGGEAPVHGRAQAFRRLASRRDAAIMSREPRTAHVSADGAMGWTDGHWLQGVKGGKQNSSGQYLTVWVKDRRGAWKVAADMGTRDNAK